MCASLAQLDFSNLGNIKFCHQCFLFPIDFHKVLPFLHSNNLASQRYHII